MDGPARLLLAPAFLMAANVMAADTHDFEDLLAMDLDELMRIPVLTASRHPQELRRAPAVVTVLDGETLRRQGYRSVAEALTQIPGFYTIDDGVGQYVVVRGINSGQRAYGRTLKVMIDGQPVGLRSNAHPFLGPELIPMSAVERIEVVRGPSSALYGADAYLGVINIFSRRDAQGHHTQLDVGDSRAGHTQYSGSALTSGQQGAWQGMIAASAARLDRSGQPLPASSPEADAYAGTQSEQDISKPLAVFAKARYHLDSIEQQLAFHLSERDSHGEFLDFGTLSHDNRQVERQHTLWWQGNWHPTNSVQHQMRVAYAWGGNTEQEHLSLGNPASHPARDYGYEATDMALESQFALDRSRVVAGVDGSWDEEEPYRVYSIDSDSGNRVLLNPGQDDVLFRNLGIYLQWQYQLLKDQDWELALNARNDEHDRYGNHTTYRAGLTGSLSDTLQLKLLYGTAFKAPNAVQLYAYPLYVGDMLGNPALSVETAETFEMQWLWQPVADLSASLTAYWLEVEDLIELQPFGINTRWENRGNQSGHGLETEWRWRLGRHQLGLTSAWHDTTVNQETPLLPAQELPTASAPRLLAAADWLGRWDNLEAGLRLRYVGPRRASEDNIDSNLRVPYSLSSYNLWRIHGTYTLGQHRFTAVIDNLFDKVFAEPGYGGIDLPGERRTIWLSWAWRQ